MNGLDADNVTCAFRLDEQPWVSVKTQFAKPEAHVALIETLAAIRERYIADLEVRDEGGYWETRDLAGLLRRLMGIEQALDRLTEAIERVQPHPHAKDDTGILAATIERIADPAVYDLRLASTSRSRAQKCCQPSRCPAVFFASPT